MKNWSDQRICDHGKMSYCLQNFLELETREKKKQKHIPLKKKGQRRLLHEFLEFQSLEKIKLRNHEYLELGFLKICRILIVPPDSYLKTVVKTPAQREKERKKESCTQMQV
jgi:hypothetical protein